MDSTSQIYAPLNRGHIPNFPNRLPCIYLKTGLPKFKDHDAKGTSLHLVQFHFYIHRLKTKLPKDFLMKIFIDNLGEIARKWYDNLPFASLYSLKDFHSLLFQHYQSCNFSLSVMDRCCEIYENFIKLLENLYGDEECMEEEIL